jgi:hypothetical protein
MPWVARKRTAAEAFDSVDERARALRVQHTAVDRAAARLASDVRSMARALAQSVADAEAVVAAFGRVHVRGVRALDNQTALPPEILELVVTFLPLADIVAVASTCKECRALVLTRSAVAQVLRQWEASYGVELYLPRDALRQAGEPTPRDLLRVLGYAASQVFAETGRGLRDPQVRAKQRRDAEPGDVLDGPVASMRLLPMSRLSGAYESQKTLLDPPRLVRCDTAERIVALARTPTRQIAIVVSQDRWIARDLTRQAHDVELPAAPGQLVPDHMDGNKCRFCGCVGEAVFVDGVLPGGARHAVIMVDYGKEQPCAVRLRGTEHSGHRVHVTARGPNADVWLAHERLVGMARVTSWRVAHVLISHATVTSIETAHPALSAAPYIRRMARQFRARIEGSTAESNLGPSKDRFACSTPNVTVTCKEWYSASVLASFWWHRDGCVRSIGQLIDSGTSCPELVLTTQEAWSRASPRGPHFALVYVETAICPPSPA